MEVDEAHDKQQVAADELRMDDIIASVNEEAMDDFLCLRVDATQSIEAIEQQITEVVAVIQERAANKELS